MEKKQYDELKKYQGKHWWFRGKKSIVMDYAQKELEEKKGGLYLDVGCGMGLMSEALSVYGNVFGMDMEEEAVNYCINEYKQERVEFFRGYLPDAVPWENEKFDLIFALDVLEHIEDDHAGACKLYDLLKYGGRLVLTVPARMDMWSYNDVINHHFRRYDKDSLMNVLVDSGFIIERISYYNALLFPIAYIVRKLKNIFNVEKPDISSLSAPVNRLLFSVFSLEKYWLRNHSFKTGVSLILIAKKGV